MGSDIDLFDPKSNNGYMYSALLDLSDTDLR